MKFFTLLCITTFLATSVMAQDTIANGNFALWTNYPAGGYNEPNDWNSPNPQTYVLSIYPCIEDSATVYTGDHYSCKLITLNITGIGHVPGTITTGVIPSAEGESITGGASIHSRPTAVTGWYQYIPAGHDTGGVSIYLIKGDSIIGAGAFNFTDTATTWTPFTCSIAYSSGSTPDTSQLTFVSSINNGIPNSTLLLDNLNYSYLPTGIATVANTWLSVYPNPANQQINIDNQTAQMRTISMYASNGQLVKVIAMHRGLNTVDVSGLTAGEYILSGVGVDGGTYHSSIVIDK